MPLSMERWVGKVAVVTGASAGIGAAIAEHLVEAGVKVVGLARRKEKIDELAEKLVNKKGKLYSLKCDVSQEENVIEAFKWVVENVGPIQILVNNAGVLQATNLIEGDTAKWKKLFDVNFWGLSIGTREAIKIMREHNVDGHIININSIAGHTDAYTPFINVYLSSKHAVKALTGTFRKELEFHKINNIKLTSISPGVVETEIFDTLTKEGEENVLAELPMLNSKDVAEAVIYTLSTAPAVQRGVLPGGSKAANVKGGKLYSSVKHTIFSNIPPQEP